MVRACRLVLPLLLPCVACEDQTQTGWVEFPVPTGAYRPLAFEDCAGAHLYEPFNYVYGALILEIFEMPFLIPRRYGEECLASEAITWLTECSEDVIDYEC